MGRVAMVAAVVVVLGLGAGLVGPDSVQAGAPRADQADKEKIIDLMKAQMEMQSGEHQLMHEIIDNLLKKYPNDPEIKALDDFHEKWHSRAKMQEEVQERMRMYLDAATGD